MMQAYKYLHYHVFLWPLENNEGMSLALFLDLSITEPSVLDSPTLAIHKTDALWEKLSEPLSLEDYCYAYSTLKRWPPTYEVTTLRATH